MKPHLYVLSGASGCGKTTLLNQLCPSDGSVHPELRTVRAPKFSERAVRTAGPIVDDVIHVDRITATDFDVTYVINNNRYAIRTADIQNLLDQNLNPVIILSDFRVIRQLRDHFGATLRALYVSSAIDPAQLRRIQRERQGFSPDETQKAVLSHHFHRVSAAARLGWWDRVSDCVGKLEEDWRAYAKDAVSTEVRAQRIRAFHIRYVDYLDLFDHVVLNYTEDQPTEMFDQVRTIITSGDHFERFAAKSKPPLFVVAAASGTGKGTMMEMLTLLGGDRIAVVSKVALRGRKSDDRRDGMIPLLGGNDSDSDRSWPSWWTNAMKEVALRGEIPPEYDLRWVFHQGKSGPAANKGVTYAVSSQEIKANMQAGRPQILVSNMQQFQRFRDLWPANLVALYLHRLTTAHEHREFQLRKWADDPVAAEIRIREKETVHGDYVRGVAEFDHVLLNTSFEEDLFDQLFRLLEVYR